MKDAKGHGSDPRGAHAASNPTHGRISRAMLRGRALARKNSGAAHAFADPYYAGDSARHAGKGPADNPHPPGSESHNDWHQGWREAKV